MTKRILLAAMIFGLLVPASWAGISIAFSCGYGLFLGNGSPVPVGALIQLIWSPINDYAQPIDGSIPALGGTYANGSYVLFQGAIPISDVEWGGYWDGDLDGTAKYQNSNVGGQTILNGFVYAYVFQDATPSAGEYYARTAIIGGPLNDVDKVPADSPNVLPMTPTGDVVLNQYQVAVPEPATMGLLIFGLLPIAVRGFRRK